MKIIPGELPGMFRLQPEHLEDRRGRFFEAWRSDELAEAAGRRFEVRQVNFSISRRNTLRGIHGTLTPPGQAKLVTCVRGTVLDVVVDMRIGSPTYGRYATTVQDAESGLAVYMAEGLGHAFLALTDDVCMNYLCSTEYVPGTMVDVQALDPEIGIPWNLTAPPVMSDKDAAAPTLAEAAAAGLLPTYEDCLALPDPGRTPVGQG
ncbi:dTDP-4-dehydrorhamnose 3,5-epimerase family protein [Plantactinospora endophytica]|uniref:dTDP-4-dehydrorhamnose 3,5-epimerase n=1 Tax=Plantactinospora endophytica TaxID=673535 RepID=A0ABQ4EBT3_9ACTN|nr:dTDP-4-dehydrorhamnose 3,5-epimerase family protein [Plantactinospora endophytica]GIG92121.1 dTDP-4-dehydrorhamnose 3,5-epimerase [Plantactinospora endophytica]